MAGWRVFVCVNTSKHRKAQWKQGTEDQCGAPVQGAGPEWGLQDWGEWLRASLGSVVREHEAGAAPGHQPPGPHQSMSNLCFQ